MTLDDGTTTAWYPYTGFFWPALSDNGYIREFVEVGRACACWTAHLDSYNYIASLNWYSYFGECSMRGKNLGEGLSVRCVKEK